MMVMSKFQLVVVIVMVLRVVMVLMVVMIMMMMKVMMVMMVMAMMVVMIVKVMMVVILTRGVKVPAHVRPISGVQESQSPQYPFKGRGWGEAGPFDLI